MQYSVLKHCNYRPVTKHKRTSVVVGADNKNSQDLSLSHIQFVGPNLFVILYAGKQALCLSSLCVCVCVWH